MHPVSGLFCACKVNSVISIKCSLVLKHREVCKLRELSLILTLKLNLVEDIPLSSVRPVFSPFKKFQVLTEGWVCLGAFSLYQDLSCSVPPYKTQCIFSFDFCLSSPTLFIVAS